MEAPDPDPAPGADRLAADLAGPTTGPTTRGQLLRNASAAALGVAAGATLLKGVDTAAALGTNLINPSPTVPTNLLPVISKNTNRLPWQILTVQQTKAKIPFKPLLSDPDTGMQVFLVRYAAGFTNVYHTHKTAHGFWVIDGILKTRGSNGTHEHGPGVLVWVPEGGWIQHGAGKESDCTFLFITNKPFNIFYESDPNLPFPISK